MDKNSILWRLMYETQELGVLELSNLLPAQRSVDEPLNETMRVFLETKAGTVH